MVNPPFGLLVNRAIQRGARNFGFSSGAPLRRADLLTLMRLARERGAQAIEMQTDGTFISSEEVALGLCEAKDEQRSVATTNLERHIAIVGPSSHLHHMRRGITACLDVAMNARIQLPISEELPPTETKFAAFCAANPRLKSVLPASMGAGKA